MILVVSHPDDPHASAVLAELSRRARSAVLLDTARFPTAASLTQEFGDGEARFSWTTDGRAYDLANCGVAWWRRPQPYGLSEEMDRDAATFAYAECHEALAGLWAALEAEWVNPPELDELAHHKPFQLRAAAASGLVVPRTTITNDPGSARRFIAGNGSGKTVYKTFLATETHWRETRLVGSSELKNLDLVRHAPVIFQEYVPAAADIRATVVGGTILAAAIRPGPTSYQVDYRMDMERATFEPTTLARETVEGISTLMARLGLQYGAIDLRRREDGVEVFLEINPAGEWLFVEERTGLPITRTMADLLIRLDEEKTTRGPSWQENGARGGAAPH